jgi:HSP20 family protein
MALLAKKQERTWDPFAELRELSDRLNRVFANDPFFSRASEGQGQTLANVDWSPSVNVSETDKAYMIRADLPDVKKEDIKVSCEKGMLTIEGERKQQKTEDNERFHRVESSYGRFMRRFALPDDADENAIEATQKDGGLTLRIPRSKTKAPTAKQIKVG